MSSTNTYICEICSRDFTTKPALNTHRNWHNPEYAIKSSHKTEAYARHCSQLGTKIKSQNEQLYLLNATQCIQCKKVLNYFQRNNKFCSRSCSTTYSNKRRLLKYNKNQKPCLNCDILTTNDIYCSCTCHQIHTHNQHMQNVIDGTATHTHVKQYLLEQHGNICMSPDCAWNFSQLQVKVELEHKDGNSENNSLDNCILLCPNCHSLTDTYKGKNKGNGRHKRRQRYLEGKSF